MNNNNDPKVTGAKTTPGAEAFVAPHVSSKFAITVIVIFMAILLLPTIAWGAIKTVSLINPSVMDAFNIDTGENRNMAKFPTSFNPQTFAAEVENWYNDNLPFRSVLFITQENIESAFEVPFETVIRPAMLEFFHPSNGSNNTPPPNQDLELPSETEDIPPETESETLPEFDTEEDTADHTCKHVYESSSTVVQEATCTEYGIIGYQCKNCDYIGNKEYTPKAAHDYVVSTGKIPTCGYSYDEIKTCSVCNDTQTTTFVKKHTPEKKLAVVKPSTTTYGYTLVRCKDCKCEYRTDITNKEYDTSYFPPIYRGDRATEGRNNWLFYRGDNSEAYYQGTNLPSNDELEYYAALLQQLNDICKERGIQLQICVWPNKDQVYPEYMPTVHVADEYKRVERIADYVTQVTDVKFIYPLAELMAAKPYCEMYWKYDTHWNNAGAFVGYQAMMKSLGLESFSIANMPMTEIHPSDSNYYTEWVRDGESSLLYAVKSDIQSSMAHTNYPLDSNYVIHYRDDVKVLSQTGGNGASGPGTTRHTTSTGPNDCNFVMLADSYRVMQLTYLEKDFTDCFLTHRNTVNNADVIAAVQEADILVVAAVERLEGDIFNTVASLIKILSK